MISNFLRSLLSEESDPVSTDDAQIALAALLVRIAKSDSQYDESEVEAIKKVLMEQFENFQRAISPADESFFFFLKLFKIL